jgi:hypothetical protein
MSEQVIPIILLEVKLKISNYLTESYGKKKKIVGSNF